MSRHCGADDEEVRADAHDLAETALVLVLPLENDDFAVLRDETADGSPKNSPREVRGVAIPGVFGA